MRTARPSRLVALVPSLTAAILAATGTAQSTDSPPSDVTLQEMARRLEQLERKNAELEGEVTELRASEGVEWLTEQRADQIRGIVQDVLSDASNRSSLQSSGMTAGWDNGFFLASADGRFKLQVGGLIQTRFVYNGMRDTPTASQGVLEWPDFDAERWGFDIPAAQIWLKGHLFGEGVTYKLMGNFQNTNAVDLTSNQVRQLEQGGGGEFVLQDAWTRIELSPNWFVRAGQFKLPFSREELIERQNQMAIDRSVVSYSLGLDYSQGVEVAYVTDLTRLAVAFSDGGRDDVGGQLKVAGTNPANEPWNAANAQLAVTGRVEFKPFGDWVDFEQFTSPPGQEFGLMAGLAAHYQSWKADFYTQPPNGPQGDNEWLNMTADLSMNFGGASLFGSFYWSYANSEAAYFVNSNGFNLPFYSNLGTTNKWGLVVQGAVYIVPKVETFLRYELGQFTINNPQFIPVGGGVAPLYADEAHMNLLMAGINWYIDGQDLKFTVDGGYSFNTFEPSWYQPQTGWRVSGGSDQWLIRAQLQLVF